MSEYFPKDSERGRLSLSDVTWRRNFLNSPSVAFGDGVDLANEGTGELDYCQPTSMYLTRDIQLINSQHTAKLFHIRLYANRSIPYKQKKNYNTRQIKF